MATRSLIGMNLDNGITKIIYCHWDGYPSHVGELLVCDYNTPALITELMELGDLSSLDATPATCTAYHRDRNEPWGAVEPRDINTSELDAVAKDYGVDYVYIYNNEYEWECYQMKWADFRHKNPESKLVPVNILAAVA
jgi:hypothetical protein